MIILRLLLPPELFHRNPIRETSQHAEHHGACPRQHGPHGHPPDKIQNDKQQNADNGSHDSIISLALLPLKFRGLLCVITVGPQGIDLGLQISKLLLVYRLTF